MVSKCPCVTVFEVALAGIEVVHGAGNVEVCVEAKKRIIRESELHFFLI